MVSDRPDIRGRTNISQTPHNVTLCVHCTPCYGSKFFTFYRMLLLLAGYIILFAVVIVCVNTLSLFNLSVTRSLK